MKIDIITVLKDTGPEFLFTRDSIISIHKTSNVRLEWIIIDGTSENSRWIDEHIPPDSDQFSVQLCSEEDSGIYDAMNKGLRRSNGDFFMFVNSGDVVLPRFAHVLSALSLEKVNCFEAKWHDKTGEFLPISKNRIYPRLGIMPNHQAMVFPSILSVLEYDTRFKISADQDLKIRLWGEGLFEFHKDVVVSCLNYGVSSKKLTFRDVNSRTRETYQVLSKHFSKPRSIVVSGLYLVKYLLRVKF